MDKKEGGKSQCYRGKTIDFDFCQVLYTAIDEIYNFRLRQEDIHSLIINNRKQRNRSSSRPVPKSATPFQEEPITLMMARPARCSTIIKPRFKASVALESYTASGLRQFDLSGPRAGLSASACAASCARPCIDVRSPGIITALVTARNSLSPKFQSQTLQSNAMPRRPASPVSRDQDLPALRADSMSPHGGADNISPIIKA